MFLKSMCKFFLAAAFISPAFPLLSQTVYDASEGKLPLSVGGGMSNFDPDFSQGPAPKSILLPGSGKGSRWGVSAWVDGDIRFGPSWLRGLGIEGQYRSILAGGPAPQQGIKESTLGAGAIYTWRHWHSLHPYGKYLYELGDVDFSPVPLAGRPTYSHDSRAASAVGGGIEVRCTQHIWARAEYERQFWGPLLGSPDLEPQGFTVGAMYHFTRSHRR